MSELSQGLERRDKSLLQELVAWLARPLRSMGVPVLVELTAALNVIVCFGPGRVSIRIRCATARAVSPRVCVCSHRRVRPRRLWGSPFSCVHQIHNWVIGLRTRRYVGTSGQRNGPAVRWFCRLANA